MIANMSSQSLKVPPIPAVGSRRAAVFSAAFPAAKSQATAAVRCPSCGVPLSCNTSEPVRLAPCPGCGLPLTLTVRISRSSPADPS